MRGVCSFVLTESYALDKRAQRVGEYDTQLGLESASVLLQQGLRLSMEAVRVGIFT